jgi:hypothetical protein
VRKFLGLDDSIRAMGIHLVAARGTGKSRLLGRFLLLQDVFKKTPTICIDFIGDTINNFFSKLAELPRPMQDKIWPRVKLIDLAGRDGFVVPLPLLYSLGNESLYEIAQRPLDIIRKADSFLREAPVTGWNPTYYYGTHAFCILHSLNMQISELENLLMFPEQWKDRLEQLSVNSDFTGIPGNLRDSVNVILNEYGKMPRDRRVQLTLSLRIKAATFTLDPPTKAMFSAPKPGLDIAEVIEKGQCVLIDGSGITDIERRRFMMMWLFSYITGFIKTRGPDHDHPPLSLVIDEFSLLTNYQDDDFTTELSELINVYSRSHRLWLTIASQSIGQFNEGIQRALLSMGTQIFGAVPDMESALKLSQWFFSHDPKAVKHYHPVYFGTQDLTHALPTGPRGVFYPRVAEVIDQRPEFYSLSESEYMVAKRLRALEKFHFMVRPALEEGTVSPVIYPVTIERFDHNLWVDPVIVDKAKRILRKRAGMPVGSLLAEITNRLPIGSHQTQKGLLATSHDTLSTHEKKGPDIPPPEKEEDVEY